MSSLTEADILIVTNQRATEVDGVIDILRARGMTIERINLCQYPERSTFSWTSEAKDSSHRFLSAKAGWFHNPGLFTIVESLEGHGRDLALNDCGAFWQGAALASSVRWLNDPSAMSLSSLKLQQLSHARQLGIKSPPTLVSNDPKDVSAFCEEYGGMVAKSLANGYSVYGDEKLKLYSRFYTRPPEDLLAGLIYSPMIFQKRIPKQREMRVTVVKDKCFGMVADTANLSVEDVDLRRIDYEVERHRFAGLNVPDQVIAASIDLVESFSLSYAGLDWVEDEYGQWLFLELNCMGAFKWSELCGAGDITTAIADALGELALNNEDSN